MEDIRKLIYDHEAAIDLESLAYTVCGLTGVLTELLRDGPPTESAEQVRYQGMIGAAARCAELHSLMLARAMNRHFDEEHLDD